MGHRATSVIVYCKIANIDELVNYFYIHCHCLRKLRSIFIPSKTHRIFSIHPHTFERYLLSG